LTSWMGAHGWCNSSCRLLTMATSPRVGLLPHKWQYPNINKLKGSTYLVKNNVVFFFNWNYIF
jgi:hypothetical protein